MKPILSLFIFIVACGAPAAQPKTTITETVTPVEEATNETFNESPQKIVPAPPAPIADVTREQLDEIVKKGPPYVLAMVQMDSVKQNGKFVGFRVVSFRTEAPSILGLQPDDVVQRINQLPLERPEQLLTIFENLKTSTEITFDILRNGKKIELRTPVQ